VQPAFLLRCGLTITQLTLGFTMHFPAPKHSTIIECRGYWYYGTTVGTVVGSVLAPLQASNNFKLWIAA